MALFHDVIYIAGRKDNEQKSADVAAFWLTKLNFEPNQIQLISEIIKATTTHKSSNFITQLFIDMDLSILGESEIKYLEYKAQIRKEHAQIPNCLYKIGRKRFLKD